MEYWTKHLSLRRQQHVVNSSQQWQHGIWGAGQLVTTLCFSRRSTRHTILGCDELTVWRVDWHPSGTAKATNLKYGAQFKKCKIRGQNGPGLGHVTYFWILGSPQYFQNGESYKLPKVVNGDDENLRAVPPSWSRGRAHNGSWRARGFGGFATRN